MPMIFPSRLTSRSLPLPMFLSLTDTLACVCRIADVGSALKSPELMPMDKRKREALSPANSVECETPPRRSTASLPQVMFTHSPSLPDESLRTKLAPHDLYCPPQGFGKENAVKDLPVPGAKQGAGSKQKGGGILKNLQTKAR